MSDDLSICLICGNIGCGRHAEKQAQRHWELTSHTFGLKMGGECVWDYAGENYVHRLIENGADGKLVEYKRDQNTSIDEKNGKDDQLEGIELDYALLLTNQPSAQVLRGTAQRYGADDVEDGENLDNASGESRSPDVSASWRDQKSRSEKK